MKLTDLHKVFMSRDELTAEEADNLIKEMKDRVISGEDPEEILHEEGLEPDYVFDLLY
jgi:hypothetical protein